MGVQQLIYATAAVVIVAVLSFQFLLGSAATQSRAYKNEVLTQVSGVAAIVIEDMASRAFDNRTREDLFEEPPATANELTDPGEFGGVAADKCDSLCKDIDDFHGLTFHKVHGGLDYEVSVTVRYVDPDSPGQVSATKQFAKEVVLNITNPTIYHRGKPDSLISIEIGRVFTYFRTAS